MTRKVGYTQPVADVASPILSLATALPLAHSMASVVAPTIGSVCHTRIPSQDHKPRLKRI